MSTTVVGEGLPEPREPVRIITQRVGDDRLHVWVKGVTIDEAAELGARLAAGKASTAADDNSHSLRGVRSTPPREPPSTT